MNLNDLYIPTKLTPVVNTRYGRNGNLTPTHLKDLKSKTGNISENQVVYQLREMEEYNNLLEKLVELRTNKLAEVVATNTKFISILAHDLRSPFCTILGALEILKESLYDFNKSEFENYLNMASSSANKTLNLVDNLLTWTIAQNKEKNFNPVKINLSELLRDEIDCINISAKQKQISLSHSVSQNLNVSADIQMVKTIIRNLISNAIKYTHPGGEINISATDGKQFVEIAVSDTGIGISNETQKNLFKTDAFLSTCGTNNEKGTGLGLIICKEFVEMHGGEIWVESNPEKPNEHTGSKFHFSLPHYL